MFVSTAETDKIFTSWASVVSLALRFLYCVILYLKYIWQKHYLPKSPLVLGAGSSWNCSHPSGADVWKLHKKTLSGSLIKCGAGAET